MSRQPMFPWVRVSLDGYRSHESLPCWSSSVTFSAVSQPSRGGLKVLAPLFANVICGKPYAMPIRRPRELTQDVHPEQYRSDLAGRLQNYAVSLAGCGLPEAYDANAEAMELTGSYMVASNVRRLSQIIGSS